MIPFSKKVIFNLTENIAQITPINHKEKKVLECQICNKNFATISIMKRHIQSAHNGKVKEIPCDICPEKFSKQSKLKNHKKIVHDRECNICHEKFSRKSQVLKHKKKHDKGSKI